MLLWFAALAVAGVALVFRDPQLDHRLVALGAVLPVPMDVVVGALRGDLGRSGPFHAVVTHVFALGLLMGASIGHRARRKRLLALSIGGFAHLVLDASFTDTAAFLWPFASGKAGMLQLVDRGPLISALLEVAGVVTAVWLVQRGQLRSAVPRRAFLQSGRVELVLRPRRQRL